MTEDKKNTIKEEVLEAIKSGRLAMRSRWQFGLHAALVAVGAAVVLFAILYFVSLVVAVQRRSGAWFGPQFGSLGWIEFFVALPWLLIILSIVFLVLLQIIVRRYSFVYSHPLLYSGIGIVLLGIAGGLLLAQTPLHPRLFRYAEEGRLPFGGEIYMGYGHLRLRNTQVGTVVEPTANGFLLEDRRGESFRVIIASGTRLFIMDGIMPGDSVVIFGVRNATTVQALGIREVSGEEFGLPRPHRMMPRIQL